MQRAAVNDAPVAAVPPVVHDVLRAPGQPLDAATRALLEPRFGHDFSGVRVHTDDRAAASARAVNALAYTVGRDVAFGPGQYAPQSPAGQRLLAHELAHVVQQGRGTLAPSPLADSALERDAERASSAFAEGRAVVPVGGASGPGLARKVGPRSLDQRLDPAALTEAELGREIGLLTDWLRGNASSPDTARLADALAALKKEEGRRPGAAPGASKTAGGEAARFRLPLSSGPTTGAASAPLTLTPPVMPGLNTPPPERPRPSLESLLPPRRELSKPDFPGPRSGPTTEKKEADAPKKEAEGSKKEDDEKPKLGGNIGLGGQTNFRFPHQPIIYVQATAEWSNKYAFSWDKDDLPQWLKGVVTGVSLLGEPGLTLQFHLLGDSPGQVDAQSLFKVMQVSLDKINVSLVGGVGFNDVLHKWQARRLTPLGGVEFEPKIGKVGSLEISWVVDGLVALPYLDKDSPALDPTQSPHRRFDGQLSGELRVSW